jgi:uncharacterized protein (TIGR03435 family)
MIQNNALARTFFMVVGAGLSAFCPAAYAATPAFVAADVHPSPSRLHAQIHGRFNQDRAVLRDATMTDLISAAYEVQPADILGGPAWLDFDRFDINAKAPAGTKFSGDDDDASGMAMLRGLLADRFGLVAKVDKRPLPAFVLTAGKTTKLKPAADKTASQACHFGQANAAPGAAPGTPPPPIKLTCNNISMSSLADILHDVGTVYFNRPVIDQTGLKGDWDIDLQWSYNKPQGGGGITLPDALQQQLGLKVESKPMPTPVIVIQAIHEKPTPNIADLDKILPPPPPAQFDVAVVRQANPDEKNFNLDITNTRVTVQYATLQTLIYKSFDTPPADIENKPKWLDDVHWDIVGTYASANPAPPKPGDDPGIDEEDAKEMIRSLLADRFKLTTHVGSKPSTVFALTADSPRMKAASDAEHSSCAEGPGPDGNDPRVDNPLRNRLICCQNMTMAQFALELHRLASGFVPAPVIDSTGLTGGYDFSLSFSRANILKAPSAAPSAGGGAPDGDASDPGGSGAGPISLFDALQKQLGLKLEKRDKVDMPTLVIDHVEPNPTDN